MRLHPHWSATSIPLVIWDPPLAVSVKDALANEGDEATMDFTVALSEASSGTVTMDVVEPDSDGAVTIGLPETTNCNASGAIRTGDGRPFSHSLSATVAGPEGISVADARVEERRRGAAGLRGHAQPGDGKRLHGRLRTAVGSAQASVDYTAANWTLTFLAGESSKPIEVSVLDDAHEQGEETRGRRAGRRLPAWGRRG